MIAVGAECYSHGASRITGTGRSWNTEELCMAINGQVSMLVFDDQGKADIQELLAGVVETSFEQEQLAQTLAAPDDIENWRVGEAIAEAYLSESGIADTACFGPEAEFYLFDDVRFDVSMNRVSFEVDAVDAAWNSNRRYEGGNLGHRPATKGGYMPLPPVDSGQELRSEMLATMRRIGMCGSEPSL